GARRARGRLRGAHVALGRARADRGPSMCGIAGIVGAPPDGEVLRTMAATLRHRGPDAQGFFHEGSVGLAHTRLRIIDVDAGRQPMAEGAACLVFNGEIYNFVELRRDLAARGHVFRTRSDTEVLLALYRDAGLDAFARLNGMFACAIWDRREQRLVLAR